MIDNADNEVFIKFSIQKFKKKHFEITSYLNIEPSKTWVEGDLKTNKGTIKYKSNGWEIELKKDNVMHIDEFLEELMILLLPKKKKLINLKDGIKKISIIVYSKKSMPSFVYKHKIISFLNDTNIELEQDIYCMGT